MKNVDKMIAEYVQHLNNTATGPTTLGYKVSTVLEFLSDVESVSLRSYTKYKKQHIGEATWPKKAPIIEEFIAFFSSGKKTTLVKVDKVSALDRKGISGDSEKKVNDWLLELSYDYDYSPHSLAVYKTALLDFFSYAADLNTENARRYIQTLHDQGKSVKTINLRITALMRYAKSYNINLSIKRPKCQKTLECENIPSEIEYRRILDYLKEHNYKHYLMVMAMATTGARVSELLQFKIEDIIAGEVVLRGKGNKFRKFFFTKEFQRLVKEWAKETQVAGYLCRSRFGDVMTARGVLEMLKKLEGPCKIKKEKLHPHAFRHFFAKMFLKKNKDVVQLADLLGHGSIDTTRIYLQRTHEEQKREFNRIVNW